MILHSQQGTALTSGERRQVAMRAQVAASIQLTGNVMADLDNAYRDTDWESVRYWNMVSNFARYGYCDFESKGTRFVGDVFGYDENPLLGSNASSTSQGTQSPNFQE